jgi:O-methyltransferase
MTDDARPDDSTLATGGPARRIRTPEDWVHIPMHKYRNGKNALPYRPEAAFFELADPVVETKRTLLGYDRLYTFWQALRNVGAVPGEMAEIGSFRGGTAHFIAGAFKYLYGEEETLHVFDTFEGHPEAAISEHDPHQEVGRFASTSYDDVRALLAPFEKVRIHQGDASLLLPGLPEAAYRLVHIDTDLYQPTVDCLEYFVPRMSRGGVIVLDDYASRKCPGVPKALAEFMARDNDRMQAWDMRTEQLMLLKR